VIKRGALPTAGRSMTNTEAAHMFELAIARQAPALRVVAEDDGHRSFIDALFVAGSPLRGILPDVMVQHQAVMREAGYRADFPAATRWIVVADDVPVGRIMIDWSDDAWLVDIALLPDRQGAGTGTAILHAYLEVVDRRGQRATLQVMRDNPALRLYERLGFVAVDAQDFAPHIDMIRAARAA